MVLWCFKKQKKIRILNRRIIYINTKYTQSKRIQRTELWRNKAEELASLMVMKEINLSHQPLISSHSFLLMEDLLRLKTWVILTVKINLEMSTKSPQTSNTFIQEAIIYDFLYKLMVMTC